MGMWQQTVATTALIRFLISTYYAHLTSVLIVYDGDGIVKDSLQQDYLDAVQQAFHNQSEHGKIIGLQWINVQHLKDSWEDEMVFEEQMLKAVDIVTEGFITILANTSRFLHARYYATRYATLRLKDKIYLFLCEHENPQEFLASELLQFYPHHLMVTPSAIQPPNDTTTGAESDHVETSEIKLSKSNTKQTCANSRADEEEAQENFMWQLGNTTEQGAVVVTDSSDTPTSIHKTNEKYHDINFELWTQRYVGAEGNLNATHLDTYWGRSLLFAKNAELYPNKLWNLQRRVMRISTLTYLPYVQTNYAPPGEGDEDSIDSNGPNKTVVFQGGEAELIRSFCQVRNCHLRLQPYAADYWGIIYENGTSEGMLGDIYKQHTEMAIGCIYNWYNNIMEVSQFISRSAVTILGPGPAQFPRWRTNIMPFSTSLWIFLVLTMIMCSLMFHFIKYSAFRFKHIHSGRRNKYLGIKNFEKTMLDIFAVFIQQPSADTVLHRVASRIFLAFLLCATITLENTYSGQLKSILTMPLLSEPVDTMDKWSVSGWKWGAPSIIWIHSVENSDIAKEQRLAKNFEVRDHEFLYNASFRDDYGFGVERVNSGTFSFGKYITAPVLDKMIVPKDDLYFDWTRAVSIRGWPLMSLLDRHISFCLETGLYVHWERQSTFHFLDRHIQEIFIKLSTDYKPKSPPEKLSIENVSGPLFILLFGHLAAFVVLLFELFGNRLKARCGFLNRLI